MGGQQGPPTPPVLRPDGAPFRHIVSGAPVNARTGRRRPAPATLHPAEMGDAVPDSVLMELVIDATAEVIPAASAECVNVHPNEPCPGFPHSEEST